MDHVFIESSIRAVLIAGCTAAGLRLFGIRNPAARHKAWTAVLTVMLLLPIWTAIGPKVPIAVLEPLIVPADVPPPQEVLVMRGEGLSRPPANAPLTEAKAVQGSSWGALVLAIYLSGSFALLARLVFGTVRARRVIRSAVMHNGHRTSAVCAVPMTVGWLRPVVILPETWPQWPKGQLDAVLIHEKSHAGRHDPLVHWLALFNRAVFWFHPLAWWLERKLTALAESACDSAVLAAGHTPQDYSEYLLNLVRSTVREEKPVAGMAMPGRYLAHRLHQIFEGVSMQPISRTRIAGTVILCTISSAVFAAATLVPQQVPPSQSTATFVPLVVHTGEAEAGTITVHAVETVVPAAPRPPVALAINAAAQQAPAAAEPLEVRLEIRPEIQLEVIRTPFGAVPVSQQKTAVWLPRGNTEFPNPALLDRLGLSEEQKARAERTLQAHRPNFDANRAALAKEESEYNRLVQAERMDRSAVLTQLDRVLQTHAELERTNTALMLEIREHLTHAQWLQLQSGGFVSINRVRPENGTLEINPPGLGAGGQRGGARGGQRGGGQQ